MRPGVGTLTVLGLRDVPVSDGVTTTVIPSVTVDASGALTVPAPVEKRWVLVDVAITPGEDNLAGEPHTFTVQVTAFDGEGGFPDGGVPGAIVDASAVTIVGGAALTTDGTCDEGTDANGQCTLIVTNPTLRLDRRAARPGRGHGERRAVRHRPRPRRAGPSAPTPSCRSSPTRCGGSTASSSRDSSTNPLGETHTFTATVAADRTTAARRGSPVPDGAFLDHVWSDPNGVSTVDPTESTCLTTGTVGGTCTFIVSSTGPTTGTLTITGIRDTWLDRNRDGDAGRDG